ncbi:MAG TPA: transglutaminase domain-containing protein [Ginsengibacter sp.]|nr:transglutaminase domain-containing protein [Ginsengibacter sp.]HRP17513.1 transglutaminase domain-containing protein [Ginsengibacter sp.]HRP45473.1 transglutaminase domain-containing protein [Ginsengibacter sp.]
MRHAFYLWVCLLMTGNVSAQKVATVQELAQWIDSRYKDSALKVSAAYRWVTENISYSTEKAFAINHGLDKRAVIDVAFERRKGVCENFAAIFSELCKLMGFRSEVIEGYTVQHGAMDEVGHAWVAVNMENDWYLFDPTWDVQYRSAYKYYKLRGDEFISSHVPYDPIWKLLPYREEGRKRGAIVNNYKDSLEIFLSMDSVSRFRSAAKRIEAGRAKNRLVNANYKVVKGQLEEQLQELQVKDYEKSVSFMNEAAEKMNDFVDYRNARFRPLKSETEIRMMLFGVEGMLDSALVYLTKVDHSEAVLVYGTGPARENESALRKKLRTLEAFVNQYFATAVNEREKLFRE